MKKEISFEHLVENGGANVLGTASQNVETYYGKRAEMEFWENLLNHLDKWNSVNLKENEKNVLEAVKILLTNVDDLEILNKKAVYLYLREITGLNTKQVVNNLNKIREKYKTFQSKNSAFLSELPSSNNIDLPRCKWSGFD